ncbi:MAG TPA: hypothetical protein VKV25_09355 [Acidimicrobiales bacterium]|nr:hypothetical protein [Acidimicrobiales bacterium]
MLGTAVAVAAGTALGLIAAGPGPPPATSGGSHRADAAAPHRSTARGASSTTTSSSTTPPPTTSAAARLAGALPPASNGSRPQTTARPSAHTAAFHAEMAVLWQAIQRGKPALGMRAFFPEAAYVQVKALSDDATDWRDRLVTHFDLDVVAAHRLLGPAAATAHLSEVLVATAQAAWIRPGYCFNKLGYWHVPGSRLVYDVGGVQRSIGIASLISWRGYWYVVHLGAVIPPAGKGVVDDPATGPGSFGPAGGC